MMSNALTIAAFAGAILTTSLGRAQAPLVSPAPLAQQPLPAPRGATTLTVVAAQRAQDLGLPTIAVDAYRRLREMPEADRRALTLALTTALLDAGEPAEAERELAAMPEPHDAPWRLRAGLAALQLGKRAEAQAHWDAIKETEVPFPDLAWYRFFTGALWDTAALRDLEQANRFYVQAEASAPTPLARSRFQLAGERVRLELLGKPTPDVVEQARRNFQQSRGSAVGYHFAEQYAAKLKMVGRANDAVEFLQREVLLGLPPQETAWRDKFHFWLGLIGDRGRDGAGRNALNKLVENGADRERQRQALQLLFAASVREPERGQFQTLLNRLVEAKPEHPVKESLLFYRAQLGLSEKNFAAAEIDATTLLKQFPLSPLRVHALGILTESAWEQQRYLRAADYARQARAEMATLAAPNAETGAKPVNPAFAPGARAALGMLEAEASFRAKEYRMAADACAALLREHRADLDPKRVGQVIFQRVLAEINFDPAGAGAVIDQFEKDPAFELEYRWQAEWSLARKLRLRNEAGIREAYMRVERLLRAAPESAATIDPELRARMGWLQATLAFDNNELEETIRLVTAQLDASSQLETRWKPDIASVLLLLKAKAEFALKREPAALETLKRLRAEYTQKEAAISSYLIEAEHYAAQDEIDEARKRLVELTDKPEYQNSRHVPYALYRHAMLLERLGGKANLEEANQRIEDIFKHAAALADDTLIFAARMRQGDIFRKRNDFPAAQRAYEYLINNYGRRPDVVLAQLALADCHMAQLSSRQADEDRAHATYAQLLFEQLRDRVDAPPDVRVEAGYKLGLLLTRRGKIEEGATVWWNDVVSPFLVRAPDSFETQAKRPYWLARTLCELGELQEKRGKLEEAKAAYRLVIERNLPLATVARTRLEQFGVAIPKPGQ